MRLDKRGGVWQEKMQRACICGNLEEDIRFGGWVWGRLGLN